VFRARSQSAAALQRFGRKASARSVKEKSPSIAQHMAVLKSIKSMNTKSLSCKFATYPAAQRQRKAAALL